MKWQRAIRCADGRMRRWRIVRRMRYSSLVVTIGDYEVTNDVMEYKSLDDLTINGFYFQDGPPDVKFYNTPFVAEGSVTIHRDDFEEFRRIIKS